MNKTISVANVILLLPFEERQYYQTFAIYMEELSLFTMKISMNGKGGKWNKTKKSSGIPFHFGNFSGNS
jgi:hypothetical protein